MKHPIRNKIVQELRPETDFPSQVETSMMNTLKIVAIGAVGVSLLGGPSARANPISFYFSVDGGTTYLQFGTTTTNGTNIGSFNAPTPTGSFSISATALGSPALAAPDFQSTALNVVSSTAGTLIVVAVEGGLTTPNIAGFSLGFTSNLGTTQPITDGFGVIDMFGTYTQLAASQLSPNTATTAFANYTPTGTYSVIEQYAATFGANGGVVNATISETSIPEPLSFSLLGAALAGIRLTHRRIRKYI